MFAEVILPLAYKGTFTYRIPPDGESTVLVGIRVLVSLGKNKVYSGIVASLHNNPPEGFEPKDIIEILDQRSLVTDTQIQFWKWLSGYYMCTLGEVMNAAIPHGLKLAGETILLVNKDAPDNVVLDPDEKEIFDFLAEDDGVSLNDIRKNSFGNKGVSIIQRLIEKGTVITGSYLKESFTPRKVTFIDINPRYENERDLSDLIDSLSKAPAQAKALEEFVFLSGKYDDNVQEREVKKSDLVQSGITSGVVSALIKKTIFISHEKSVSRIHYQGEDNQLAMPSLLSRDQDIALKEIKRQLEKHPVVLLHGVTSSGKTELYIHLINEQIKQGKQVLYLLPEIALTTQIIQRLKKIFGNKIGVYHSRYSDNERVEVYLNIAGLSNQEPFSVILGVRSAIFLPFKNLGLIIIDEEHESTYKQFDPAPRYHARDASTILGIYSNARVIMGTATPSFETLYNAKSGKYGYVSLTSRFGEATFPEVIIANLETARKRKQLKSYFTPELIEAMEESFSKEEQVILFQNRRGYSNYFQCESCGEIVKCKNCDVSLTYHKFSNELICHYCGLRMPFNISCSECNGNSFQQRGFGTEKIEDSIKQLFPNIKIGRIDQDMMKSRKSYEKLIGDFENYRTQVLVGTQMVTKGLDFENVSLVGILDADSMLNFPDFRAFERSYQLMEQVSGRAGRRKNPGKVIIQTTDPDHPVIRKVLNRDTEGFFLEQLEERKAFRYPPYVRMIRIALKHEIPSILDGGAVFIANELHEIMGNRVLGPQQPPVGRTHGKFIKHILIKVEKDSSYEKVKALLTELIEIVNKNPVYRKIRITLDVDPL